MSSLSSVVSNLVRASMGTSVSPTVTDEDLDRHVRELLIKDAKKRAERYGQQGIRAYLASGLSDSNAPKANKRFLSSIIRSTDDHNKTVLRAQALAAEEVKKERREQESRERRARAEEAVAAERMRRLGGRRWSRHADESESWDRWDGRKSDRHKRKQRDWETWDGNDEHEEEEEDEEYERDRRRRRSHRRLRDDPEDRTSDRDRRGHRCSRSRDGHSSSQRRRHRSRSRSLEDKDIRSSRRRNEKFRSPGLSREHSKKRHARSPPSDGNGTEKPTRSRSPTLPSEHSPTTRHLSSSEPKSSSLRTSTDDLESRLRKKLKSRLTEEQERETEKDTARQSEFAVGSSKSISKSKSSSSRYRHSPSPDPPKKRRRTSVSSARSSRMSISRSPTPGPNEPDVQPPSKMDKYFKESYDPRLDVAPLSVPKVPATGLIDNAEFEGWDAMLELLRVRREDKAEKKRLERIGYSKEDIRKTMSGIASGNSGMEERWSGSGGGVSIMDIQYNKRGSVREWDMGKEGF